MHDGQSLSPVRWEGKYHVVLMPKDRTRVFYGKLQRQIGGMLRERCRQRGGELLAGHGMPDPVHRWLRSPPQYRVAYPLGFLKGKRAVRSHRELLPARRLTGLPFWAAGYGVSTVGWDEAEVRPYLREQEELEQRQGEVDCE